MKKKYYLVVEIVAAIFLIVILISIFGNSGYSNRIEFSLPQNIQSIYCLDTPSILRNETSWKNWRGGPAPYYAYYNSEVSVYAYDMNSNRLYKYAKTNITNSSFSEISCNLINNSIYCINGPYDGIVVYSYQIGDNKIIKNSETNTGSHLSSGISCALNNNIIYCINGPHPYTNVPDPRNDVYAYSYDTLSNKIIVSNNLTTFIGYQEASGISCVYVQPNVYCVTGPFFKDEAAVYKYDTINNKLLIANTTNENSDSSGISCISLDNKIYCIVAPYGDFPLKVYRYDANDNSFDIIYNTSTNNNYPAGISCVNYNNNEIYCITGPHQYVSMYKYDVSSNELSIITSSANGVSGYSPNCFLNSNKIVCIGRADNGIFTEIFDIESKSLVINGFYDNSLHTDFSGRLSCISRNP